jgi:predicted transcriptional regulator
VPATTSTPRLGDLERVVMERLWDAARAASTAGGTFDGVTVRDVHDALSARGLAYTTVMTVLDRLAKKGLATRERDGRAWRYQPADTREALTAQTMRQTLEAMAVTDRRVAMLHFLDGASSAELDDLRAALAEVEARSDGRARRRGR